MNILGISAYYHDSAAVLLVNGEIIAAAQEERFSRKKHDSSFPTKSIDYILSEGNLNHSDIDYVAFYDKPLLKFERLLETYIALAPKGFWSFKSAMPIWLKDKLFLKAKLIKQLKKKNKDFQSDNIFFSEHHFSHAASAFYPSPFEEAIILTLDGVGEWATTTVAIGKKNNIEIVKEIHFPHSLGLLYSAFTYYTGFKVNSGEYKLMGLAPYGVPKFKDLILNNLIDLKEDGSFRLDMSFFNYATGLTMITKKFSELFKNETRNPETGKITQFHMDIAASIQSVTEEVIIKIIRNIKKEYGCSNLCLAGGVALNCVANGAILREKILSNLWIQPAAGDAGGALGAAQALWHQEFKKPRKINLKDSMQGSYLGPSFSDDEIESFLQSVGAVFKKLPFEEVIEQTATALSKSKAVGWFQGRMEFGPRALGGRSILGDPRSDSTQKNLNLKVKYRESFRPFAPAILEEDTFKWFKDDFESPYMLLVTHVNDSKRKKITEEEEDFFGIEKLNISRSTIPAVTHVDYSARIQTVSEKRNPEFYKLISKFKELTNCPILVNTSFNIRSEPIVCSPAEAYKCFMGTELDVLSIGSFILIKEEQSDKSKNIYLNEFELD